MRRPTDLAVDTDFTLEKTAVDASSYLSDDASSTHKFPPSASLTPSTPSSLANVAPRPPLQPSILLLFSLLSRRDLFILVLPAVLTSIVAGGVAPFMTFALGQFFDAFSDFPITPNPPAAAKSELLRKVGLVALELIGLGFGALALSSVTSSLWIWTGERNLLAVRKRVYAAVMRKEMAWFDTKMGADESAQPAEGEAPSGAGGLMANFSKDTDDVRTATSLATGMLVQYSTTCIAALILAFTRSWALTLVILSAIPVIVFIQALSQTFAGPHLNDERTHTATAATLIDRAVSAIATVKAFNAEDYEQTAINSVIERIRAAATRALRVWGITSGASQFVTMAMFVQGFWFGSKLVRDGTLTPGAVQAVFWACLIATSNLQMCIPQLIIITKGKFAIAALLTLAEDEEDARRLRGIVPSHCRGHFDLEDVTFAYPSRPTVHVLEDVSLFLPAQEMSFIVGSSGSGKSTVAQLLLRAYRPSHGVITLDDQDVAYLDEAWVRTHVAAVSQGCILFDMSVHDNVAMGLAGPGSNRKPQDVSREEVERVCRAALMHEFVRDLPDGYETRLGNGGANLSGGQKQRLAIARALLRNPTVLILDEATSALDAVSRVLVFEAIKRWRQNMTTIVITHDLSQVEPEDFVYVLKDGRLAEQGFRSELQTFPDGEFRRMLDVQSATGGFQAKEEIDPEDVPVALLERADEGEEESPGIIRHHSLYRPITMGNWMLEVIAELTNPTPAPAPLSRATSRASKFVPPEAFSQEPPSPSLRRYKSFNPAAISPGGPKRNTLTTRRLSLQFTPTSATFSTSAPSIMSATVVDDDEFEQEKDSMRRSAEEASRKRTVPDSPTRRPRVRWDEKTVTTITVESPSTDEGDMSPQPQQSEQPFLSLMRDIYPTVPRKWLIMLGLLASMCSGAMTPIFSFLLSRLAFEVSIGAKDVKTINMYGGIVLAVAAADGLFLGMKYFIMETAAIGWVTRIRTKCVQHILAQDKKWFDRSENSPVRLMQILIKDGDDARSLIATVLAQGVVVTTMLSVGLIWAFVLGWQITLVGLAIAPVFAITMTVQSNLVGKCENRNKRAREEVAKGYYEAISNVRGIRAMGLESAFGARFDHSAEEALAMGLRGAFVEGCTYGVASALIYLSEALIFYIAALFVAHGTYTYLQMLQVIDLVVFSISIGSQLMNFTQRIAKSVQATRDFNRLLKLTTDADESRGILKPTLSGNVVFDHIDFSYPERPDVPVLKNVSLSIKQDECVAVVGSSGSGKSTIAALLQRLYEPSTGTISVGLHDLRTTDVHHLREQVAIVSQNPNLFDATIAENIAYGHKTLSHDDIQAAAKAASVHNFIMSLPKGYDTVVGENASLISGGQAQRLQIARALARPSRILILDECTSALDGANQAAVMETIRLAKHGRTTVMITHKLQMMQMCDRILVVHDGSIAEEGTYETLMQHHGIFAQLASGGEWESSQ